MISTAGNGGERFGRYVLLERLGVGGMASVHRAVTQGIDGFESVVAVKRILPHLAEDPDFVASFVREAKLASLLQHPNIVRIHELGRIDGDYFMAMEYVSGHTLLQFLRWERTAGPPPNDVVVSLLMQLCDALEYAHTRTDALGEPLGIVHRDLSPSNLIIEHSGYLKVIDFGIAKAASAELHTASGLAKGKHGYMSPEALRARPVDARSDVYSAGVVAHELLTGRRLFTARDDYETLRRVMELEVEAPSLRNPRCPPQLDEIVLRALARDPDDRWQSAGAMRDALEELALEHGLRPTHRAIVVWIAQASEQGPVLVGPPAEPEVGDADYPSIVVEPHTSVEETAVYAADEPTSQRAAIETSSPVAARPSTTPAAVEPESDTDDPSEPSPNAHSYIVLETPAGKQVTMLEGPSRPGVDLRTLFNVTTPLPRPPARWPVPGRTTPASSSQKPLVVRDAQSTSWRRRDTLPPQLAARPPEPAQPRIFVTPAPPTRSGWWLVGALAVCALIALVIYLAW